MSKPKTLMGTSMCNACKAGKWEVAVWIVDGGNAPFIVNLQFDARQAAQRHADWMVRRNADLGVTRAIARRKSR